MQLLNQNITTALAASVSPTFQFKRPEYVNLGAVCIQGRFLGGASGTSVDCYVQTSIDDGSSWIDVAQFHFTSTSQMVVFNVSSLTPITASYITTDGTLAVGTAKDGIVGQQWRTKTNSSGVYQNTNLTINISPGFMNTMTSP